MSDPVIAEMVYGDLPLLVDDIDLQDGAVGELDSLSVEILAEWANRAAQAAGLGYTKGNAIAGYTALFCEGIDWKKSGSLGTGRVRGLGLATAGERRKRRISAGGQEISVGPIENVILVYDTDERGEDDGEPVEKVKRRVPKLDSEGEVVYKSITTPSGIFDRWSISQAFVTVQDVYFVTSEPLANVIGTAQTPPSPPTPPASPWGSYSEAMRARHPNGWVLDNREIEQIYSGLWAVTDTFGFYYTAVPD